MKLLTLAFILSTSAFGQFFPYPHAFRPTAGGTAISSTPQGSCSAKLTNTCTFDNATSGTGICIVVFESSDGSANGYVSSVTDSGSSVYTQVGGSKVLSDVAGYSADMWYKSGAATGITSITVTLASGTSAIVAAMWFNNCHATPLDDSDSWINNTPTQVTSSVANTMVLIAGTYAGLAEDLCDSYATASNAPSLQSTGNLSAQFFALTAAGNHTPANCGNFAFFTAYRIAIFKGTN